MTEKEKTTDKKLNIQRIYTKDSSCTVENSPDLFRKLEKLKHEMDLKVKHEELDEKEHYEVTLDVTVTTRIAEGERKDDKACVVNVKQAGIFQLEGFEKKEREM